jgi:hypothetical protein
MGSPRLHISWTPSLFDDAATKGVEAAEGLRAFFAPPLRILFSIDEGDRIVEITSAQSWMHSFRSAS